VLVVRSAQGLLDCLTRLRERDGVVLRDFAQQQLQELRRAPIEHNASLWTPRWADGADLGPVWLNVVGEPVEPLFSNVGSEMLRLRRLLLLSR